MAYRTNVFKRPPEPPPSLALPRYDCWYGGWRKVGSALKQDSLSLSHLIGHLSHLV